MVTRKALLIKNSIGVYGITNITSNSEEELSDLVLKLDPLEESKKEAFIEFLDDSQLNDIDLFVDYDRNHIMFKKKINEMRKKTEKLFKEWIFDISNLDSFVPMQHISDTPKRLSKMYITELFKFATTPTPKITTFENKNENNIVKLSDIEINSLCSHHFVPYMGKATIAYIPDAKLVGLSKLPRLCAFFGYQPSVQEELTKNTIEYINAILQPKAIYYKMTCEHLCMKIRGVKSAAVTTTDAFVGDISYYDKLIGLSK
jgi:GTP cyclohydrolase I